ncbi:MAG: methyltransferase domain-containing protein [Rhizobacter sp.]
MKHQGGAQVAYAGSELLLRGEEQLANYNAWIVDMVVREAGRPRRVLDFGAGVGTLARLFHARTGIRPEAVELDPRQRQICEARGFTVHGSLAESGGGYDLAFSSNVLEHIEDDVSALAALHASLAPGGRLIVYLPAFPALWTALDDHVGHFRRYRRRDLERKLETAGFTVRRSRYSDSVGFVLALAYRVVGRGLGEPSGASLRLYDRWLLPLSKGLDLVCSHFFGKNVLAVATKVGAGDQGRSRVT